MKIICTFALLLALAACGSGGTSMSLKPEGSAQIGDQRVSFSRVTSSKDASGLTPLFFSFTSTKPRSTGVTEAHWQRESARQGISVDSIKSNMGKNAYPTQSGGVAPCIMIAIRQGLCGAPILPLTKRAQLAEQALQASTRCRWTGFDPAYHVKTSSRMGAGDATLWVKADCR